MHDALNAFPMNQTLRALARYPDRVARGGELASKAQGLRHVITLGRADYGVDL